MENSPLGRLESVDLRDVWTTEDRGFTSWLARPENLGMLAETLGVELKLEAREQPVGPYRADLLCKQIGSDAWVLIENQLERTDHTHLGQLLTYAADLEAVTIIWIAASFSDKHSAALDWLNRITDDDFRFFGIEIELWRIGSSPRAPKFNVVSKPNDWSRSLARSARAVEDAELSETQRWQRKYWDALHKVLSTLGGPVAGNKAPQPENWMEYSVGRTGFSLHATVKQREKQIQAALYIEADDAKAFFGLLERDKEAIESDFGQSLDWQRLPQKQASRIALTRDEVDPAEEKDWIRQHHWLADKLNALHRVFSLRIENLDAADWRGDDREPEG